MYFVGRQYFTGSTYKWIQLLLGYVIVSITYFLSVLLFGGKSSLSYFFTFGAHAIFLLVINSRNLISQYARISKILILLIVIPCAILLVPHQTITNAESTTFKYWSTGNNDVVEAFCGANSILNNTQNAVSISMQQEIRGGARSNYPTAAFRFSESWKCSGSSKLYYSDLARLQYSNMALFSNFTKSYPSFTLFTEQSLLNIILLLFALAYFGTRVMKFSRRFSIFFAATSVSTHLFFVTFLNGHIGTLMVGAPLVLFITLSCKNDSDPIPRYRTQFLLGLFIALAYPFILPFLIILVLGLFISKVTHRLRSRFFILFVTVFTSASWLYFKDERFKALTSFRSWGSFLTPMAPLQYFGIIPGNIMGSRYLGLTQSFTQKIGLHSALDFGIASIILLAPFWILISFAAKTKLSQDMRTLFFLVVFFSIDIAATSQDPYYFYKISYIFQFIVLGVLLKGIESLMQSPFDQNQQKMTITKKLFICYSFLIIAVNLFFNTISFTEMIGKNFKWATAIDSIKVLDSKEVSQAVSFVEEGPEDFISYYVLSLSRGPEVANTVAPLFKFSLDNKLTDKIIYSTAPMPSDSLKIMNSGIYPTERDAIGNFRWVSGAAFGDSSPKWPGIRVLRLNSSATPVKVSLCAKLSEFGALNTMPFRVTSNLSHIIFLGLLDKKTNCFKFIIPAETTSFDIATAGRANFASLFDRRRLLYKLESLKVIK